ncbi:MAG: sulfur carrier protein ThiS [Chloroflexi bacterium]|nr:sulfur carrier protein ThiS [Chloroflexota bacterium]
MIKLTVNGQPRELEGPMTVLELLRFLGVNTELVAVGHNGEVIPRNTYASTVLRDGDVLEIVRPVGGG